MLKGEAEPCELGQERDRLFENSQEQLEGLRQKWEDNTFDLLKEAPVVELNYPIRSYPEKIKSLNFDKDPVVEGTLLGVKGQYLILSSGVLNVRKFSGYEIEFSSQ
jgi:hypothetical protein